MPWKRIALRMALLLLLHPVAARADGLFTGFVGGAMSEATYGLSLAGMSHEAIGVELDLGFSPDFFDTDPSLDDQSNSLLTIMGNLIIGIPIQRVRPYGSGGIGLIRRRLRTVSDVIDIDRKDFGVNLGGGIVGFITDSIGVRGDVRYFRSLEEDKAKFLDFGLGHFDFWRGSVGLVLRF